ncbi:MULTISPECIES: cell division protein SepF [Acetomicrobium]|jgi:cell division inhibitor SepF|uniref:Cell division inhibitor SepF n=2 Tax=Acetomicrobium TaxID=49894 RepID=A0A1H3GZC1_9BACT|nr:MULTISPECIES: cell division protein SepF [Acetomicrobium]SDY07719.1 cell division inhibitor SepF [Acetomicrobium thermoterrenum DSM 13490]HHZ05162.1 cell division protein SepF [Acetomicrobium hydrogeniformans]
MLERFLALLGISEQKDEDLFEEESGEEGGASGSQYGEVTLIYCKGSKCVERREDLAEALHGGKIVVIDLKGVEKAEGQSALDFICGVAYAMRGVVMRIAPAVFLATPKRNLVDLWEEERVEAKDHE